MNEMDRRIGHNLARLREPLAQKDLAERMRERGWKWSQATVWAVERGDRPLRLAEADDLATILARSTNEPALTAMDLLAQEGSQEMAWMLRRIHGEFEDARNALIAYRGTQVLLRVMADENDEDMTPEQRDAVRAWARHDPVAAVDGEESDISELATRSMPPQQARVEVEWADGERPEA